MPQVVLQDGDLERLVDVDVASETIEKFGRTWKRHGDYLARRAFTGEGDLKLPAIPPDLPLYVPA